jgi:uncharacterized protein YbjQ (UPF0145 family)
MSENANGLPPADWYPDPRDPAQERYWDGTSWTTETRPVGGGETPAPAAEQPAAAASPEVAAAGFTVAEPVAADPASAPSMLSEFSLAESQEPAAAQPAAGAAEGFDVAAAGFAAAVEEPAVEPDVATAAAAGGLAAAAEEALGVGAGTFGGAAEPATAAGGELVVATAEELPGHRISRIVGVVVGVSVRALGAAADHSSLAASRDQAVEQLRSAASEAGGNAVVAMRFDSAANADGSTEVIAYGTAVVADPA